MDSVLAAIIASVVCGVVIALSRRKAKKIEAGMDADDFIVRRPRAGFIFSAIFTTLCIIMLSGADFTKKNEVIAFFIFLPIFSLGPILMVFCYRWKITVKGNQISYTPLFGKERSFLLGYITTVRRGMVYTRGGSMEAITAYHGKKKLFGVTDTCPGFNLLASRLESEGVPVIGMKDKIVG